MRLGFYMATSWGFRPLAALTARSSRPRMLHLMASPLVGLPSSTLLLHVPSSESMETLGSALSEGTVPGDCVCLEGDLGAGKTTLCRAFIRSRLKDPNLRVTSPSYLLDQVYDVDEDDDYFEIHHMDLYRLAGEVDLEALDLINVLANSISLLEWPDRLGSFTPSERLDIDIRIAADDARTVRLTPHGKCWEERVKSIVANNPDAFNVK